jgi:RND superfamily putative drug exporter
VAHYVGGRGHVTRLDVVMRDDPLPQAGLHRVGAVERALRDDLPAPLRDARTYLLGSAAGMRDLEAVTTRDRKRVNVLAAAGVFVVLLVLLRRGWLSDYLILTVVLGYLTTFGLTLVALRLAQGSWSPGPDWKVPFFLFTILVAVGEDYNIFLVTRVREEERRSGPVAGVAEALRKTGGVITSCGLIMAGTFASLLAGSLAEVAQMGFALAVGVLLDTLVIRPLLVPAFLLLRRRGAGGEAHGQAAPAKEAAGGPARSGSIDPGRSANLRTRRASCLNSAVIFRGRGGRGRTACPLPFGRVGLKELRGNGHRNT